jgi:secretion/DNA translocation related TadE-like protein
VMAAGVMTVLLVLTVAGAVVGSAVIARHRAQAAADLAALAAAGRVASGREAACASAGSLTAATGASVSSCTVAGLDVVVTVEVPIRLGRWGVHAVHAQARAGPADG